MRSFGRADQGVTLCYGCLLSDLTAEEAHRDFRFLHWVPYAPLHAVGAARLTVCRAVPAAQATIIGGPSVRLSHMTAYLDGELAGDGVVCRDEVLRAGLEVVEDVLLVGLGPLVAPVDAELAAAPTDVQAQKSDRGQVGLCWTKNTVSRCNDDELPTQTSALFITTCFCALHVSPMWE